MKCQKLLSTQQNILFLYALKGGKEVHFFDIQAN
jgi:hypothetical protein